LQCSFTINQREWLLARYKLVFNIFVYVFVGLLVTLLLVTGKMLLEKTVIGHRAEALTFEFLQGQLSPFNRKERLPVLVVDISQIPGGKAGEITPRKPLAEIIEAIADQQPRAIAIDIDFSPDRQGWRTDNDPDFFDHCLKIREEKGVPIFLGVNRTSRAPTDTWLGVPKYKELAVTIAARDNTTRMYRWIQAKGNPERLRALSAALAESHPQTLPKPPQWLAWAIRTTNEDAEPLDHSETGFAFSDMLVNYSKLEAIRKGTISTITSQSVREEGTRFTKRLVILGDAEEFTDAFCVTGRERPIAGVYLHACAAYTVVTEPLYEFKETVRLALDIILSFLIIMRVALIRFLHMREGQAFAWHKRQATFIKQAVIFVIVGGMALVRFGEILWLDFFLVAFALLLHPSVERWLYTQGERVHLLQE
jgi:CHASE2 domain-containing sensor protein